MLEVREIVDAHLRDVFDRCPDYRIELRDVLIGNRIAVAVSTHSETYQGMSNGIQATGESFVIQALMKFMVAEGKLEEESTFFKQI